MRYLTEKELELLVGVELLFESVTGLKKGVLVKEGKKFWLPSCGQVNALTVKILK